VSSWLTTCSVSSFSSRTKLFISSFAIAILLCFAGTVFTYRSTKYYKSQAQKCIGFAYVFLSFLLNGLKKGRRRIDDLSVPQVAIDEKRNCWTNDSSEFVLPTEGGEVRELPDVEPFSLPCFLTLFLPWIRFHFYHDTFMKKSNRFCG
jgi:hypothetical protein